MRFQLILALLSFLSTAATVLAQASPTDRKHLDLSGPVQRVQTFEINDANHSQTLIKDQAFNSSGQLIDESELERSIELESSFRVVYTYDPTGQLVETSGFKKSGTPDRRTTYTYTPGGKKIEESVYFLDSHNHTRFTFDEHGSMTLAEYFDATGTLKAIKHHRYEYLNKGNISEVIYYPPSDPKNDSKPSAPSAPDKYRTIYVHDDTGRLQEEFEYISDDRLNKKKTFDKNGVLREELSELGYMSVTINYDEKGREIGSYNKPNKQLASPEQYELRTQISYDSRGNKTQEITRASDGAIRTELTITYEFDTHGNWISKTEKNLEHESHGASSADSSQSLKRFRRTITYF